MIPVMGAVAIHGVKQNMEQTAHGMKQMEAVIQMAHIMVLGENEC